MQNDMEKSKVCDVVFLAVPGVNSVPPEQLNDYIQSYLVQYRNAFFISFCVFEGSLYLVLKL